jgi:NAD(P)-dependent dehydrogenase (short-subunit alcohol dehydrogenase family)
MASRLSRTRDGLEQQFGVNCVAHQHLTTLLLPALAAAGTPAEPSRVVNLSSMGHWLFPGREGISFEALPADSGSYHPWVRYGETKLGNILHAGEVTRRARAAGQHVVGVALHPGAIMATKLGRHMDLYITLSMLGRLLRMRHLMYVLATKYKSIAQGSATSVLAALDPAMVPSAYYADCQLETYAVHTRAFDAALSAKLFAYIEDAVAKAKAAM